MEVWTFIICLNLIIHIKCGNAMTCREYIQSTQTGEQSGYMGTEFLVIVQTESTEIAWNNQCLSGNDPTATIISYSSGVKTTKMETNSLYITLTGNFTDGEAIILLISDPVTLYIVPDSSFSWYAPWPRDLIPINKIGREYFVVFPKLESGSYTYFCRLCAVNNNTVTVVLVESNGKSALPSLEKTQLYLNYLDVYAIRKDFDFSGARLLSNHAIGVFCFVDRYTSDYTEELPYQMAPAHVFDSVYHVPYFNISLERRGLRMVAVRGETSVVSTLGYTALMESRGDVFDVQLDINTKNISVIADKPIIILEILEGVYHFWAYFIFPETQYVNHWFIMVNNLISLEINYFSTMASINNMTVEFARMIPWQIVSEPPKYHVLQSLDYNGGVLKLENDISGILYCYIRSSDLVGGSVEKQSDSFVYPSVIPGKMEKLREECRLVMPEYSSSRIEGNITFVDSCSHDYEYTQNDADSRRPVATIVGIVILSGARIVAALADRTYLKNRSRKRVRPSQGH